MAKVTILNIANFPLPATPPGYFLPNANGANVPNNHASWNLIIDTTGLPDGQPLADCVVQYHYTNVQLGVTGLENQGQVTNTDGSVTQITGGNFTGWIDDCESPLDTTFTDKQGVTQHVAALGCGLDRIINAYPDKGRVLVLSSPGYSNVPGATLNLN